MSGRKFIATLYIGILILFTLAGVNLAPFHGDESTIINMSNDWYSLINGNLAAILYNPNIANDKLRADQELRLLNGTVSKFSIGFAETLTGIPQDKIPGGWAWFQDYWENRYYGHLPDTWLLLIARLPSVWLFMISMALVFKIAQRAGGMATAYIGTFIYATLPFVQLNVRRAMFEGANLLGIALVIWCGLRLISAMKAPTRSTRKLLIRWMFFGLACGFAMACKHVNALIIAAVGLAIITALPRRIITIATYAPLAGICAFVLFLVLNPTWWSNPVAVPQQVLTLRTDLLKQQIKSFGAFETTQERVSALLNLPFGPLQYEEDGNADWSQFIGSQYTAYDTSVLSGVAWFRIVPLVVLLLLSGSGAFLLTNSPYRYVVVVITLVIMVGLAISNPLAWQRYYLPEAIPFALLMGNGLVFWAKLIARGVMAYRQRINPVTVSARPTT